MNDRVLELIEKLQLVEHPEGGYYKEVFCSEVKVFSSLIQDNRPAMTDIYFLLSKGQTSKFHNVIHDEIWHFYEGDPLILHVTDEQGNNYKTQIIGKDNLELASYKAVIKGGYWQAAQTMGEYSLVGCTVGAGFDFKDFKMLEKNSVIANQIAKSVTDIEKFIL